MSHQFVAAQGFELMKNKDPDSENMTLTFIEDGSTIHKNRIAIFAPKIEGDYQKAIIECAVNMLYECVESNSLFNRSEASSCITINGIDEEFILSLKQAASGLQYLINSDSWQSGIPKPYDVQEICKMLDFAKLALKRTLKRE